MLTFHRLVLLVMSGLLLTSCLTRRNVHTSGNLPTSGYRGAHTKIISTDASSTTKNLPVTGPVSINYAEVLGVAPESLNNVPLYEFINSWMGTPYRLGGTDKKGLDCSAFTNILFREIYGLSLPRTAREMAEVVSQIKEKQLEEGDLLFFTFENNTIDHVGIYLQNHKFVHVSTGRGVIISDLNDDWYHKYFKKAGSVL